MLTYLASNYRQLNPLEFDNRSVLQAANLLLGKSATDALLKEKGSKGTLLLLGALEDEADQVRRNAERPLPNDAHPKDAEARKIVAEEIQQWRQLHLSATQEMQLPYRLRGENQRRAIFENHVTLSKTDGGTNAQIQVCLADLKQTIEAAEKTGECTVKIQLPVEDAEFLRTSMGTASVSLVFQDELSERPETKRAWLGNVAHRCEVRAKAEGTLPADELAKLGAVFSGKRVNLTKGGRISRAEITGTENGIATIELGLTLPEIVKLIEANPEGGKGAITDGTLRLHSGTAHGCNGRDFVASSPQIVAALWKNAQEAAAAWLGKENPSEADVKTFLEDYSGTTLTMRTRLRPKNKLEPAKSKVSEIGDILPGAPSSPEYVYGLELLRDVEPGGASCPAAAGPEWADALAKKELESTWENEPATTYANFLKEKFGLENSVEKSMLIHANFLGEGLGNVGPLDGGQKTVKLESFYLTASMEEEFQKEKEERDQEIFDSKAETAMDEASGAKKEEMVKSEWMEAKGTIILSLDADGAILHRLKRYNNRRTGLGVSRTKAEWLDPEISMPRRSAVRWEGKQLRLQDFLTDKGLEELEVLKKTGGDWEQNEIADIEGLIADWQSSLRRLDMVGKNPIENKIRAWMNDVADGKADAKCGSINELLTIFGPSVRAAGKVPYEKEKTPENLQMPVRSNPIPLMLLCGTGYNALETVKDNPADLWDMTMRWQCAARLQEDPLPERTNERLDMLEAALADGTSGGMIAHAMAMELAERPDTTRAYLEEIGLDNGVASLPPNLAEFGDLIHPIKASPRTAIFKQEETSLDDLAESLAAEKIDTAPTEAEAKEINGAVDQALAQWRNSLTTVIGNIEKAESPTGQDVSVSIILAPEEGPANAEKDAFETALDVLHTTMPQSRGDVSAIAEALLTHCPKTLRIETGTGETVLRRGSGGTWIPESGPDEASLKVADRVNEIEAAMSKKADDPSVDEETWKAIGNAAVRSHGARIVSNVDKIAPALRSLPEIVSKRHSVAEIVEPLKLIAEQVDSAVKAKALAHTILADWNTNEDQSSVWGWGEEMTLDAMGLIEFTCQKIMGETTTGQEESKQRNYYAAKLIGEKDKLEAAEILGREGKQAAGAFLEEVVERNMGAIHASASANLPGLLNSLRETLSEMVARSYSPEIVAEIKEGPIGTMIEDRRHYEILEGKIRKQAGDLAKTKGAVRMGNETTYEQVGRDIIPGHGPNEPVMIEIDQTGTKVQTNKVWAKGWLKTPHGARNVQKRINTLSWLKSLDLPAKTGLAFMAFCRGRMLHGVTSAIENGDMSASEQKTVKAALEKFTKALGSLGINTQKHSLRTQMLGAAGLHQYSTARFARRNPWSTEWEKPLEDIRRDKGPQEKVLKVDYSPQIESGAKINSPFKKAELLDSDSIDETETGRNRLKSAARAVAAIYKPVTM